MEEAEGEAPSAPEWPLSIEDPPAGETSGEPRGRRTTQRAGGEL